MFAKRPAFIMLTMEPGPDITSYHDRQVVTSNVTLGQIGSIRLWLQSR